MVGLGRVRLDAITKSLALNGKPKIVKDLRSVRYMDKN